MPPNTVMLSQMMRDLSAKPGFTEAFLALLQGGKKSGPALLTPDLIDHLRDLIVGKNWDGLDHFPGWTMAEITPTVGAISRIASDKDSFHMSQFLDVGHYAFDATGGVIDLREPSRLPGFSTDGIVSTLGYGVTRGDGPGPLAPEHAESQRLADALNRLSANGLEGVAPARAIWNDQLQPASPEALVEAIMATGETVTVTDSRYFANFGHLHYNGQDVMMPFYVNSQILIPGTNQPLLVPVSHAEYEWHIRGARLNADVSFYFGIDGKAEFRTMDELDQAWVMKRDAHTYRGAEAIEVTRLSGKVVETYMRLHQAHPALPFGGYYAFGVCQDGIAAIELKLTGKATLFPNTADDRLFDDPRDAEINQLIHRLPKDRDGRPAQVERIFASLPVGDSDTELAQVTIPGLGAQLVATHDAWTAGTLRRTRPLWSGRLELAAAAFVVLLALGFAIYRRRKTKHLA